MHVDPEEVLPLKVWRFIVVRRRGRCERCGAQPKPNRRGVGLEAHHRNHDARDHRLSNGEALCTPCHVGEHAETRKRIGRTNAEGWTAERRQAAAERARALWADPAWRKRTLERRQGTRHYETKVDDEQVQEIRRRRGDGETLKVLAEEYGVSITTISNIYRKKARTRA